MAARFGLGRLGAAHFGQLFDPVDDSHHFLRHRAENVVRSRAVAGTLQILESAVGVPRKRDATAGENGDAARMRHLFNQ